jgi:hypothetical protein
MTSEPDRSVDAADQLRLSIFQQDWWLKIAKGSARLKEVQVHGTNGAVIGSLTYIVRRKALGISWGGGPHLSHTSGPIVCKNLSDEEKTIVLGQLFKKLPIMSFTFSMAEHTPDASLIRQAFECAGFKCFEHINFSQPPLDVISRLGTKLREHIKQAHSKLNIINIDADEFINFYRANLNAADKESYFPLDIAKELITIGIKRERPQARIIAASRKRPDQSFKQPVIDAAICIVWDSERCYYWLSTRRKGAHPDSVKLLIVIAMKHAEELGLIFDVYCPDTSGSQRLFKTIFRMPNEEKRYTFTRSRWTKLYEAKRSTIHKLKNLAIAFGPPIVGVGRRASIGRGCADRPRRSAYHPGSSRSVKRPDP